MKRTLLSFVIASALSISYATAATTWEMRPVSDPTRWAVSVGPNNALPEYPRPQLVREGTQWKNLNGLWSFAITPLDSGPPSRYGGKILVPFPIESALSGVKRPLQPDQLLWYRRVFATPKLDKEHRLMLHFDAVDYRATVYVNGHEIGTHLGGYESFRYDVTDSLRPGENELIVRVFDPTDTGSNPRGKQTLHPRSIFYTASSGIWQTVWSETVPATHIDSIVTTPDVDGSRVLVRVQTTNLSAGENVELIAKDGTRIVSKSIANGETALQVAHPHLWSPADPFLYNLDVRVIKADGTTVDRVSSYFGMRSIKIEPDESGKQRIVLNGRVTYNLGVLDQGFWPDGLYTAPTDSALKFDIQAAKAMGFNTIRKHAKIEPERWYYYCDKFGMLVWQDMVPPGDETAQAHVQFQKELMEVLRQLHNHPSIVTWVLFNEGWGAFDQARLASEIKKQDPSRLVDAQSGANVELMQEWQRRLDPSTLSKVANGDQQPITDELNRVEHSDPHKWDGSDITDIHVYPGPQIPPAQMSRAQVLGEFGGIEFSLTEHNWNGTAGAEDPPLTSQQLKKTYTDMVATLKSFEAHGLSGSIFTQAIDVEDEMDGLITYDRAVVKMPFHDIARINEILVPRDGNYASVARGFTVADVDQTSIDRKYAAMVTGFSKGNRNSSFLRHLTLLALKRGEQVLATETGNDFINQLEKPYSRDAWEFMATVTRTSRDSGFSILRIHAADADYVLGKDAAETVVRRVVGREEIDPVLADKTRAVDWGEIERRVIDKYGVMGAAKVFGTEMIHYLNTQDWPNFGKYYLRYFDAAKDSTEYPVGALSYTLLKHISDRSILESAVRSCANRLTSSDTYKKRDPVDLDVYAGLLYKVGRRSEAMEWEELAKQLSQGRDKAILAHFEEMKSGAGI